MLFQIFTAAAAAAAPYILNIGTAVWASAKMVVEQGRRHQQYQHEPTQGWAPQCHCGECCYDQQKIEEK